MALISKYRGLVLQARFTRKNGGGRARGARMERALAPWRAGGLQFFFLRAFGAEI